MSARPTYALTLIGVTVNFCVLSLLESVALRTLILRQNSVVWRNADMFRVDIETPGKMLGVVRGANHKRLFFDSQFFFNFCCNCIGCSISKDSLVAILSQNSPISLYGDSFSSVMLRSFHFSVSEEPPAVFYDNSGVVSLNSVNAVSAHILFSDVYRRTVKNLFFYKPGRLLQNWLTRPYLLLSQTQIKAGLLYNSTYRSFQLTPKLRNNFDGGWWLDDTQTKQNSNYFSEFGASGAGQFNFSRMPLTPPSHYFSAQQFGNSSDFVVGPYSNFLRLIFS